MQNQQNCRCDACGRDCEADEVRYLSLKTCCSLQRIPLCRDCHAKYSTPQRNKEKRDDRD